MCGWVLGHETTTITMSLFGKHFARKTAKVEEKEEK